MIQRRNFLIGLLAAPAIVRAASLMPVKAIQPVYWMSPERFFTLPTAMEIGKPIEIYNWGNELLHVVGHGFNYELVTGDVLVVCRTKEREYMASRGIGPTAHIDLTRETVIAT